MKDIYIIDSTGIYQDIVKANLKENTYYDGKEWLDIDFNYVETQPPSAKIVKYENDKWVTVEEYPLEEIPMQPPSTEERIEMLEDTIMFLIGGM